MFTDQTKDEYVNERLSEGLEEITCIEEDHQNQTYEIDKVEGVVVTFDHGWCVHIDVNYKPVKGSKILLFGRGIGFQVRGVALENPKFRKYTQHIEDEKAKLDDATTEGVRKKCLKVIEKYQETIDKLNINFFADFNDANKADARWWVVRYKTPKKMLEDYYDELIDSQNKKIAQFEATKDQRLERINALPQVLRDRIFYFRKQKPDFIYDSETYELFIYEQAVCISNVLKNTGMSDKEFKEKEWSVQKLLFGQYNSKDDTEAFDGHSGNTFGCACGIAGLLINDPDKLDVKRKAA